MKPQTWAALEAIFEDHPILCASGVLYDEIDAAAREAGFQLDADYREFVHRYGGAMVGPYPVFGLRRAEVMGRTDESVFEITRRFREQRWPGTSEWLVFSVDHGGNPIGLDRYGKVWIHDHDFGGTQLLSNSFEDYLRHNCLNLR